MRCQIYDSEHRDVEMAIVDAWIIATDCAGIAEIIVEPDAVILRGTTHHPHEASGTALRHGDLFADLTAALSSMRRTVDHQSPPVTSTMTSPDRSSAHPYDELDFAGTASRELLHLEA